MERKIRCRKWVGMVVGKLKEFLPIKKKHYFTVADGGSRRE